jgi:phosphatidylglycerophosphate synthase
MSINQHFNQKVKDSTLLHLMYIISSPLAKIFVLYNIKPNTITTLSNLSALISFIFIFYDFYLFAFFWTLSLILDICDGIVARATKQSNAFGSFYDHFSDVLKIMILYFIIAQYYNSYIIWVLISLNMIIFATVDYLDGVYGKKIILTKGYAEKSPNNNDAPNTNNFFKSLVKIYKKIKTTITYKTLFIMHGHYNLILIPLALNERTCMYTLVLTFIISLWSSITVLLSINKTNRLMMKHNIPWK